MAKTSPKKRLTQLEATLLFTIAQGDPIDAAQAANLVRRGLAYTAGDEVFPSDAGRDAFRRFMRTELYVGAPPKTFTVQVINESIGSARATGTWETQEAAEDYARREAARSRKFAVFEVWTGNPRNLNEPTGISFRGEH